MGFVLHCTMKVAVPPPLVLTFAPSWAPRRESPHRDTHRSTSTPVLLKVPPADHLVRHRTLSNAAEADAKSQANVRAE